LYDTVADCLPLLASGRHRKKALLVISDGIDTNSRTDLSALKQLIYQSEALIYAIGLGEQTIIEPLNGKTRRNELVRYQRRRPFPLPFPIPGGGRPPRNPPIPGAPPRGTSWPPKTADEEPEDAKIPSDRERVDVAILHEITDDSGGRTELLRQSGDLDAATSRIADELSRQYYLAYPSRGYRDGRWHTIRVEVTNPSLHVRARRGYVASVD
jgi:VWFA-related protein